MTSSESSSMVRNSLFMPLAGNSKSLSKSELPRVAEARKVPELAVNGRSDFFRLKDALVDDTLSDILVLEAFAVET